MSDLREALESSFETVETAPEPAPAPAAAPDPVPEPAPAGEAPSLSGTGEGEEPGSGRPRGPDGKFVKAEEKPAPTTEPKPEPQKPAAPPAQAATPPATEKPAAQPPAAPKAPASWKPAAREEWTKIPPNVQAEVVRREREVQQALQESSEARQSHQRFKEAVAPYEQMIRAEGAEPMQAVQGLLQTAYALRFAPLPVKADMIAKMVQAYLPGRDGLEMLDQRLAGQPVQQGQPQGQPQALRDPRVDQLLMALQQQRQAQQQTVAQRAQSMIQDIQKEEFFEDVRLDMADILEVAQRRGLQMTPKQAYDRACALNPEISKVLAQREEARRTANPQGSTLAARRAASSPRTSPAIPPRGERTPGDLRADLEAAADTLSGRT